jgi:hypothetical protein
VLIGFVVTSLFLLAGRYFAIERETRQAWARVALKKLVTKTPYRGETAPIVAGFYHRAPRLVRLVAFVSTFYGLLIPLEWLLDGFRHRREDARQRYVWSAMRALLERDPEAAAIATRASHSAILTMILFGSITFALTPILISYPAIFAALGAFVLGGVMNAWLLARVATKYEEAFKAEAERPSAHEGNARPMDEKEIPTWLARALERRAASRAPHVRIATTPTPTSTPTSTSTSTSTSTADADADAYAAADEIADDDADAPKRRAAR